MKKLYGIRYKNGRRQDFIALEDHPIPLYDGNDDCELVVLREEPTEPCEWCGVNDGAWCETYHGRMVAIDNEGYPETLLAENWTFCPNCGRSLT